MAAAEAAALDAGIGGRQLHGNHPFIKQGHQPAHRPAEATVSLAPAHEAPSLQGIDPAGDQAAQQLDGGLPLLPDAGEDERPFRGLAHVKIGGGHAAATGEADGGRCRLPVHEGLLRRWPLALLFLIGLALR